MNNNLLNIEQILKILPHRYLLLIDKVINIDFNNYYRSKNITINVSHILLGILGKTNYAWSKPSRNSNRQQASAILAFESRNTRKGEDEIVYFFILITPDLENPLFLVIF